MENRVERYGRGFRIEIGEKDGKVMEFDEGTPVIISVEDNKLIIEKDEEAIKKRNEKFEKASKEIMERYDYDFRQLAKL